MKLTRMLAMAGVAALLAAASVVAVAAPASAAGTTYYVNSATGSDSAAGTSPSTPWKTLTKVSATTFAPGDSILLNRGQSWTGQLHPLGSGTAGSPITIGPLSGVQLFMNGRYGVPPLRTARHNAPFAGLIVALALPALLLAQARAG